MTSPIPHDKEEKRQLTAVWLNGGCSASSENMAELPDNSVHLMVTSPPYNVGKEYDENLTLNEYRAFLKRVWSDRFETESS